MKKAIILYLFAMVSLATSAAKVNQIMPVKRTNKLDLEHLIDAIGVRIAGTGGKGWIMAEYRWDDTKEAPKVVELLAKTGPKNVAQPMLKFSIDDLLALNEWTIDDCTDAEIKRRRDMCTKYFIEGSFKTGSYEMASYNKEDFVNYNLGKYCWKVVDELKARCPLERKKQAMKAVKKSLGFTGRGILSSFHSDVKNYITNKVPYKNEMPDGFWQYYQKAVKQVFANSSDKSKLKEICKDLVAKLNYFSLGLSKKWKTKFEECNIVNNIQDAN